MKHTTEIPWNKSLGLDQFDCENVSFFFKLECQIKRSEFSFICWSLGYRKLTGISDQSSYVTISAMKIADFSTSLNTGFGEQILETILKFRLRRKISKSNFRSFADLSKIGHFYCTCGFIHLMSNECTISQSIRNFVSFCFS